MSNTWRDWLSEEVGDVLFGFPDAILDRPWDPNDDDRRAAWLLYTELRTRICTQPLQHLDGGEAAALTSIFSLFDEVRELIKHESHTQAEHFSELGFQFLNQIVRPFTAEWHMKSERGQLDVHDTQVIFRRQLTELQVKMRTFCSLLGRMARGYDLADNGYEFEGDARSTTIEGDIEFPLTHASTIELSNYEYSENFQAVLATEKEVIEQRRNAVAQRFPDSYAEYASEAPKNLVGLALSGGGIRSATLCQGVLQGLGKTKVLLDVDYLSTVSGGGYFGTFISSFLNVNKTSNKNVVTGLGPADQPFGVESGSSELEHLRNNSRYLLAGGTIGLIKALSQLIYGAGVQFALLMVALLFVSSFVSYIPNHWFTNSLWSATALWVVLIAGLSWAVHNQRDENSKYYKAGRWWELATLWAGIIGFCAWVLFGVANLVERYELDQDLMVSMVTALVAIPIVLIVVGILISKLSSIGLYFIRLAFIAAPLLFAIILLYMGTDIVLRKDQSYIFITISEYRLFFFATIVLILVHTAFLNINLMTLHRFYKNRLSLAYSLGADGVRPTAKNYRPLNLSELGEQNRELPYHLINTTLNGQSEKSAGQARRNADFFLLSKKYCGSDSTGYWPTKSDKRYADAESCNLDLDLSTAMAISGAAVSPNMGTVPLAWVRGFLAVSNLRMGYWFRRPNGRAEPSYPHLGYLLREYMGNLPTKHEYLNLSDGGHIENLGIYTLLRRKCKFIIAVDGEADLGMTRGAISRVIRMARQDMGIEIDIDTTPFSLDNQGHCQSHFVVGKITYADGDQAFLLYIKSSMTGNEPDDVKDYRRRNVEFPHQTTADQFFDEEQFEAYRALGEHMAAELLKPESIGARVEPPNTLRTTELFERIIHRHIRSIRV